MPAAEGKHSHDQGVRQASRTASRGSFKGPKVGRTLSREMLGNKELSAVDRTRFFTHPMLHLHIKSPLGVIFSIMIRGKGGEMLNFVAIMSQTNLNQPEFAPWYPTLQEKR